MIVSRSQVQQNQNKNKIQKQNFRGTEFAKGFTPSEMKFLQAAARRVSGVVDIKVKRPLSVSLTSIFPLKIEVARSWKMFISHAKKRKFNTEREFKPSQTKQNRRVIQQELAHATKYVQDGFNQEVKWG